ncbi:DNA ligase [Vibrio sp.]|uniref:DNA ligase n=1 Tax=Vibrio sp. TaxID=678 RepID=UPI003AA828DC
MANNQYFTPLSFMLTISCLPTAFVTNAEVNTKENDKVQLMLANEYDDDINLQDYYMSEKLDGIRAFWDGEQFYTRNGHPIHAPKWFTKNFPNTKLDGELWAGRGEFSKVQRTVLDDIPNDEGWTHIRYVAFDMIDEEAPFTSRSEWLTHAVYKAKSPYLERIEYEAILSRDALFEKLEQIERQNGEGLMLRKFSSLYQHGRSEDLLKLKSYQDDEAVVIGYKPGKGRNALKTGSLYVEWKDGKRFYIGSGLTDELRENPPALGSKITFRFNGYTQNGLPRFARFVYVRNEGA